MHTPSQPPYILSVDMGSSSLRAMIFDSRAEIVQDSLVRIPYSFNRTPSGGAELNADEMFGRFMHAVDEALARTGPEITSKIAGVATASLASNLLGVDDDGQAITPVYTYADTRDAPQALVLAAKVQVDELIARTGAPMHSSFWAPRFVWLAETQWESFNKVEHWMTLHEYFLINLFGYASCSYSMASWTGMLNQVRLEWDEELLGALPISPSQLPRLADANESLAGLKYEFGQRWPQLRDVPFFLAIGDGAASNLGCGATSRHRAGLTLGTTGALRVVVRGSAKIPEGLWLYRVDRARGLLGGSLSNGGNLIDWLNRTWVLHDSDKEQVAIMEPDTHGLTVLPLLAGERSPGYHVGARGAIKGLTLNTQPTDILRACMEAIAYRFALIYDRLEPDKSDALIANGRALLTSPAWMQILTDVLGHPLVATGELEASARGAALLALESLGIIRSVDQVPASLGIEFQVNWKHHEIYNHARVRQEDLYRTLLVDQVIEHR